YERADDSFEFLRTWSNVRTAFDQDKDHLCSLWERRNSIVAIPMPNMFGISAIERRGQHEFVWIDLLNPAQQEKGVVPGIDLNSIQVTPCQFYLNRHGNLC